MDLRGAAVAVTGATGFLGRYLVDVLLARGARVIGVVRNPGRVPGLAARGVELRQADLGERDGLARGFAGAQAVVSNAALFSLRNRSWEDHQRANIQGTENVFGALADAGVRRVVHVSSVAVYRAHRPRVTEDAPQLAAGTRRTFTNAYSVEGRLGAARLASRRAVPPRADGGPAVRDLRRLRPELHGGVPPPGRPPRDGHAGAHAPPAGLRGRRRGGDRPRPRAARLHRPRLQRDRRRCHGVGVRARVAGGGRARRARPAAAAGSVEAWVRHHA